MTTYLAGCTAGPSAAPQHILRLSLASTLARACTRSVLTPRQYPYICLNHVPGGLPLPRLHPWGFLQERVLRVSLATWPNIDIGCPKTNLDILVIYVSSRNRSFNTKSNHRYPRIHLKDFVLKESSLHRNAAVRF